jgi:hypothetical protein
MIAQDAALQRSANGHLVVSELVQRCLVPLGGNVDGMALDSAKSAVAGWVLGAI